jgi:glyoxylase-like metal-dependent hydrolase (beta-lactamase superfamily II)
MEVGVYCLNVGQANCLAVLDPVPGGPPGAYQAALIDVGVDGHRLAEWLRDAGVRRILLIALTHNDEDHILGLTDVVQAYRKRVEQLLFVPDRPTGGLPYRGMLRRGPRALPGIRTGTWFKSYER